ncbi:MAG: polysaccharide synthesis protein GtrA [Actinobacteria bacterium]|nr:MAG: polysaccharide synthesis protein GtrA [Actinomycetota bacterium]
MPATATGEPPVSSGLKHGLLHAFRGRFGQLLREVGKFGTVGGISFIVDIALFNILRVGIDMEVLAAKTISTIVAATVAFIGNRFWTWRHRERSGLAREYGLYFLFNAVGLGIGLACVAISHYGLGAIWPQVFRTPLADNISANVIGVGLGTLFRFWSYRRFVFVAAAKQPVPVGDRE